MFRILTALTLCFQLATAQAATVSVELSVTQKVAGCGLGSGFATLASLFMLAGFALSIRRNRA